MPLSIHNSDRLFLPPDVHGMRSLPLRDEILVTAQDAPISGLMSLIDSPLGAGRPVSDETGLTDHYDFKTHFEWRGPLGGVALNQEIRAI